jgi:hypothetical protein
MQIDRILSSALILAVSVNSPDHGTAAFGGEPDQPVSAFRVGGVVDFDGETPERRVVNMDRDAQCVKLHGETPVLDEDVIVNAEGRVKNVFVYVHKVEGQGYPMPEGPAVLDQKGCMYEPRVQGLRAGQTLNIHNGDPILHNVRSLARTNRAFNIAQPKMGMVREKVFERPELAVKFKCDVHPWMTAYLFVLDHPFFSVTNDEGSFSIAGLPPGEYVLHAWHETFGKLKKDIAVAGDVTDANFTFQSKKK